MENKNEEFFWNVVFSNLSEYRLLKIIQYNKHIQKILKKNIVNYKMMSGKFIENESTTKRKIYDTYNNQLIFEGEYLNGKKNGKGKEYYDNGQLKFEGMYLNGEKNGRGKEYDINGKLIFEGEYSNGKRNEN